MRVQYSFKNLDPSPNIEAYADKKIVRPVAKLITRLDPAGLAEFHIQLARTTRHHHKGLVFRVSGTLRLPGKTFRFAEGSSDIRAAIDMLKNVLRLAVEKHKARELVLSLRHR